MERARFGKWYRMDCPMKSYAVSRKGQSHERNMDFFRADDGLGLYAVADGIGTKRPSDSASRLVVEKVFEALAGRPLPAPAEQRGFLGKAIRSANTAVFEASKAAGLRGISTTLTMLCVPSGDCAVAHVGDSRCYLLDPGGLRQLTDDHNAAFEAYKTGAIPKEGLRSHPDRHLLTRCIGSSDFVVPDIVIGIKPAGKFLLCTDGLTKSLDDAEIARIMGSGLDGAAACGALADAAVRAGTDDDVTILLVEP